MRVEAALLSLMAAGLLACGQAPCSYPEGALAPMTYGAVIPAYSWPEAQNRERESMPLSLQDAACGQGELDWTPYDVLLFVSSPSW